MFPDSGDIKVLSGGQVDTNVFFCFFFCSLLSCLVTNPNQFMMDVQRTDWMEIQTASLRAFIFYLSLLCNKGARTNIEMTQQDD